jgi:hypothetical protein
VSVRQDQDALYGALIGNLIFNWPMPTLTGSLLVLVVGCNSSATLTPAVGWNVLSTATFGSQTLYVFYSGSAAAQSSSVITASGVTSAVVCAFEVLGLLGLADGGNIASGSGTTIAPGICPAQSTFPEFMVIASGWVPDTVSVAAFGPPFSIGSGGFVVGYEASTAYQITTTNAAIGPSTTASGSVSWASRIVSFK